MDQISSNKLNDVTSRGRQPVLHVSRPAVRAARVEAGGGRVEAGGRCCTCRRRRPVLDSGTRLGLHGSRPLVLVRSGGHATTPAATRVGDDREEAGGRRKTKLDHDRSGRFDRDGGRRTAANGMERNGRRGFFLTKTQATWGEGRAPK